MQYYPNREEVVLAIGDCGIGIRASLATNPKYSYLLGKPHHEAALKAFEPLVTRFAEGGTGLTEVQQGTVELGGTILFSTGDGYVRMSPTATEYGEMAFDLPGVQVQLSFPEEHR